MEVGYIVASRKYFTCHFSAIVEAGLYILKQNSQSEFSPQPKQTSHTLPLLEQQRGKGVTC